MMDFSLIKSKFSWKLAKNLEGGVERQDLYKYDVFLDCIEFLISERKAWSPIIGGTKRTELESKLTDWINSQMKKRDILKESTGWDIKVDLDINEFPLNANSKRTISTSKTIIYLIDKTEDLIKCYESAFKNVTSNDLREKLNCELPCFLFISNSIESGGRAFSGDPFTGQIAAFSSIFCYDLVRVKERNFVSYYPHQLFSQFFTSKGKPRNNKGVRTLRYLVDLIITAKGILLLPKEWDVIW